MEQAEKLAQFLAEEVRDRSYADLLLSRTIAAGAGNKTPGASGNIYYVEFGAGEIVIEHHYLENWAPLYLPRQDFFAALIAWRKKLVE